MSMVAEEFLRRGHDFAPKVGHTVCVIHALVAAIIASSSTVSGLYGKVVIDPARPVCVVDQPCSAPDKDDVLGFWRRGRRIATTRTHADGSYRISLPPGRYTVTTRRRTIGRGLAPSVVVIPRGRYARVNFTLDIGIR